MSDQKLRDLERRWKETGTVEDEAAYLVERVRIGDLTRERLELAASCGHVVAARLCLPETTQVPFRHRKTPTWLSELPQERRLSLCQAAVSGRHPSEIVPGLPPFCGSPAETGDALVALTRMKEQLVAEQSFDELENVRTLEWAYLVMIGEYPGLLPPDGSSRKIAAWALASHR